MPKFLKPLPQKPEGAKEAANPDNRIIHKITFFGDSSIETDSPLYKLVSETAKLLATNGYAIVNGGGPGVMKAATEGAELVNGETEAIYWEPKLASIFEGKNLTNVTDQSSAYSNYMMRTMGLIENGHVYVCFQGGTGTISEFGMVWALAKLYFGRHKPVILVGEFWHDVVDAMQKSLLLDDNELSVLHFANTAQEVLELIEAFEMEVQTRAHKTYQGDETPFVLAPRFTEEYKQRLLEKRKLMAPKVMNETTKKQLQEFTKLVQPPARVLDIGSGVGADIGYLSGKYSVTSVDNDDEMVEISRFENPNADVQLADIRTYELQENVFKGIWARDVLHFLNEPDLNMVMQKLARTLVPGGVLAIIVREGTGESTEEDVHAGRQVSKHFYFFTTERLEKVIRDHGLELVTLEKVNRSHGWLFAIAHKPE
jgi:predicted Rossmann-fold nucleotide-binding protein/SAM-dependent methyltransferase